MPNGWFKPAAFWPKHKQVDNRRLPETLTIRRRSLALLFLINCGFIRIEDLVAVASRKSKRPAFRVGVRT